MEHYSHIRMEAKRKAIGGLTRVAAVDSQERIGMGQPRGHSDLHVEFVSVICRQSLQVVKDMVGPNGLEPLTSTVSSELSLPIPSSPSLYFPQLTVER